MKRLEDLGALWVWPLTADPLAEAQRRYSVAGSPTTVSTPYGIGLRLDGSNDYIVLSDAEEWRLRFDSSSEDFTIVAWARLCSTAAASTLFAKEDAVYDGYALVVTASGQPRFRVPGRTITSNVSVDDALWHVYAVVVDRDRASEIWVDGELTASGSLSSPTMSTTTNPTIGARSHDFANKWCGEIACMAVFPYAFLPEDCTALAADWLEYDPPVHYWGLDTVTPPDEGVGSPIRGASANSVIVPGVGGGYGTGFNGTSTYVDLGRPDELRNSDEFTITFWAKTNDVTADQRFLLWWSASDDFIEITLLSNSLYFTIGNGPYGYQKADLTGIIENERWHHYALVFNGSESSNETRMRIYVDGEKYYTSSSNVPTSTADLDAGKLYLGYGYWLDGAMDEFAIFDQALTQHQVQDVLLRTRRGIMR